LIGCFALLHAVGLCVVARSLLSFPFPFHFFQRKNVSIFFTQSRCEELYLNILALFQHIAAGALCSSWNEDAALC